MVELEIPGGHSPIGLYAEDELVGVKLNGKSILGIDLFYVNPTEPDPDSANDGVPHIIIGYWRNDDDGEWVRLLDLALDEIENYQQWP